jgi:3-methyladenine DNA glycosylase AlkD
MLINKYQRAEKEEQKEIFDRYLDNTEYINNWDLVDTSAQYIVGAHLSDKKRSILYKLAKSDNLWERRIAILSTFYFIKSDDFEDTLAIAELLLKDEHDLIHKAVGWMLREIGKRREHILERFLDEHVDLMPRTMLRYAIEKLSESDRQIYLSK